MEEIKKREFDKKFFEFPLSSLIYLANNRDRINEVMGYCIVKQTEKVRLSNMEINNLVRHLIEERNKPLYGYKRDSIYHKKYS